MNLRMPARHRVKCSEQAVESLGPGPSALEDDYLVRPETEGAPNASAVRRGRVEDVDVDPIWDNGCDRAPKRLCHGCAHGGNGVCPTDAQPLNDSLNPSTQRARRIRSNMNREHGTTAHNS